MVRARHIVTALVLVVIPQVGAANIYQWVVDWPHSRWGRRRSTAGGRDS